MSYVLRLETWAFCATEEQINRFLFQAGTETPDILVTHSPPFGKLDFYADVHHNKDGTVIPAAAGLGSEALRRYVDIVKPPLHVFGHIHEQHGLVQAGGTTFINAAILGDNYEPKFDPIVVDLQEDGTVTPVLS